MALHPHSIKAYREAFDALQGRKRKVFNYLAMYGAQTDRQVMDGLGYSDMNNVRPRITELMADNLADEVGHTKCPVTQRQVRVVKAITECKPNDAQMQLI